MRIFIAGASGVIGVRLVPELVGLGHEVAAMTRSPDKVPLLEGLGAVAVVCDVYQSQELNEAVARFGPDVVVHQLTDLPDDQAAIAGSANANARIRVEGTDNLLAAAQRAGVDRFIAQSIAWRLGPGGAEAVEHLEQAVLGFGGTVLRYGQFYGPGTFHPDVPPPPPRIHIDEAARRTVAALDVGAGVVEIVEPA